jgi:hypothetical protein
MPMIISTPEDWFRSQGRDLHVLNYQFPPEVEANYDSLSKRKQQSVQAQYKRAFKSMTNWLAEELPEAACQTIGPSEYSGYICGGPSYLSADFTAASLAKFQLRWCGEDSPWRCDVWPLAEWRQRLDASHIIPALPHLPPMLRWWDTPEGVILMASDPGAQSLSSRDAWLRLHELQPALSNYEFETVPYGLFYKACEAHGRNMLVVEFVFGSTDWSSDAYAQNLAAIQRLRAALGLGRDAPLKVVHGDF